MLKTNLASLKHYPIDTQKKEKERLKEIELNMKKLRNHITTIKATKKLKRNLKKRQKRQTKTVISLERTLPNAEATEMTNDAESMRRETRSGGSSKASTTETSKSRSESGTKSSRPSATGRPMSPTRLKKSASDRRESSSIAGRSEKSTSIS